MGSEKNHFLIESGLLKSAKMKIIKNIFVTWNKTNINWNHIKYSKLFI